MAAAQGQRWQKLLQYEHERRVYLEDMVEQLGKQHSNLEKQILRKSLNNGQPLGLPTADIAAGHTGELYLPITLTGELYLSITCTGELYLPITHTGELYLPITHTGELYLSVTHTGDLYLPVTFIQAPVQYSGHRP